MDASQAKRIIEGLIFISGQPVTLKRLTEVVGELEPPAIRQVIGELTAEYLQAAHAFRIQEVAGGYQLATDAQLAPWVKRLLQLPRESLLSKASLEALAIIAYRQPLTKAEIEMIRGVDSTATLETLLERQFIRIVGRKEAPGRPLLYGTTEEFLRHFGLKGLEALPPVPQGRIGTIPGMTTPEAQPIIPKRPIESEEPSPSDPPAHEPRPVVPVESTS